MSELRDIFPSKRAFVSGTHAHSAASVCSTSGHIAFVSDTTVVAAQTQVDRCSVSLSIAACAPPDSKYVSQHAATIGMESSVETRTRDTYIRAYSCAAWSPCGLRAAGRSDVPLLLVGGGVSLSAQVLKPSVLVQSTSLPWTVVATPSEALWNHQKPSWIQKKCQQDGSDKNQPDSASDAPAPAAAAAAMPVSPKPQKKRRKSTVDKDLNSSGNAVGEEFVMDDTEKIALSFVQRLGLCDDEAGGKEEEDDDYSRMHSKLMSTAANRARSVVPVTAAWSDIVTLEPGKHAALLAVASKRIVTVSVFPADSDGMNAIEDGSLLCIIEEGDLADNDDITFLTFSHNGAEIDEKHLADVVLMVGYSGGIVRLYHLSRGSATFFDDIRPIPGMVSFISAAQFIGNSLFFVRGNTVVSYSLKDKAQKSSVEIDSFGLSLSYSPMTNALYVGTVNGTVKIVSCSSEVLTKTGELHCGGSVMGVACSPSGDLLYCLTQPSLSTQKKVCASVSVFLVAPSTSLADLLSICEKNSLPPGVMDSIPLVLSRCSQADLLPFVNSLCPSFSAGESSRKLSFMYVVLSKAKSLLFDKVDPPLADSVSVLSVIHTKVYLEEALTFFNSAMGAESSLSGMERLSLFLHVSYLREKEPKNDLVKRALNLITGSGSPEPQELCPICHSGLFLIIHHPVHCCCCCFVFV